MVEIIFYEKPGCINNSQQKKLLRQAGHTVVAKSLLSEDWSKESQQLLDFFAEKPISDWFNPSAPMIKQGLINPLQIDPQQAIKIMLAEPILIRRPLIQIGNKKISGFNLIEIEQFIGLSGISAPQDLESCPKVKQSGNCDV